jgi:hypothetical protein
MTRARTALVLVALSFLALATAGDARAQSRSWTAARAVLPSNLEVVAGINVGTIKNSALFQQLYPALLAQAGEAKEGVDAARSSCGIDVTAVVSDITVAIGSDEKGLIVVALKGTNAAKLQACIQKLVAQHGHKGKLSVRKTGKIVEYSMTGEDDKFHAAWLAADVVAFATDPEDKALLQRLISGKGSKPAALAKANTAAAVWVVVDKAHQLDQGMNMKLGYGSLELTGATMALDAHLVLASAKEATDCVAKANQHIADMQKSGQLPPQLTSMAKNLKLLAVGDEAQLKLSLTQQDLMALLGTLMSMH